MKKLFVVITFLLSFSTFANDYLIYNISQDLPMGEKDEVIRKNYYLNMGKSQGLTEGTKLNVYRRVSKANPYDNKKRVSYKVKIGELEVIHADDMNAIGVATNMQTGKKAPIFELKYFMIGDHVSISVD